MFNDINLAKKNERKLDFKYKGSFNFLAEVAGARRPSIVDGSTDQNIDERMKTYK